MANEISNSDDIIDSRDVIERIEELTEERDDLRDAVDTAKAARDAMDTDTPLNEYEAAGKAVLEAEGNLAVWQSDYGDELAALEALADEGFSYAADWHHGGTLIRASYFVTYCQEMLEEDIGELPRDLPSYIEIDWEATARNLKIDYTEIDFDGVPYLIR